MVEKNKTATGHAICVNFYDSSDLSPLFPPDGTDLYLRGPSGTLITVSLQREDANRSYSSSISAAELKRLCESGVGKSETSSGEGQTGRNIFEIKLKDVYEIECQSYASEWIAVPLTGMEKTAGGGCCCAIPIPLFKLEESCTIRLRAYDCSFTDFIENAESFLDGIELTVTAVRSPALPNPQHQPAARFRSFTFTGKTVRGYVEIPGLPLHQLYQLDLRATSGYIPECPVPPYLYICCERSVTLEGRFRPCGQCRSHSVIFVHQECPGMRLKEFSFQAAGNAQKTDSNGIWNVATDCTGMVHLQEPGYQFVPAQIDLSAGDLVTVVAVAPIPTSQHSPMVETIFTDFQGNPFPLRDVFLQLPSGEEIRVRTDTSGRFHAPASSRAYAKDDQHGLAVEPFLISELGE